MLVSSCLVNFKEFKKKLIEWKIHKKSTSNLAFPFVSFILIEFNIFIVNHME